MCDKFLLLVNTIKNYPCLYNQNLPEYMKKDVTEKAWTEIAAQVQLPVYECKEKWRNLRYSLLRSLKPNPDGSAKKKYYLHKEMEFIVPFMKSKVSGFPTEEDTDDETLFTVDQDGDQNPLCELEFYTEPPPKKRKAESSNSQKPISSSDEHSRKMFLLSLLPEINVLTEYQMKLFRRKIFLLLDNITEDRIDKYSDNQSGNMAELNVKIEPL